LTVLQFEVRLLLFTWDRDSSVGIANGYRLDGPRIESRWGRVFRIRPDRPWVPPSLLYNGYRFFPGGKAAGHGADHPPLLAPGQEKVGLFIYPSLGLRVCYGVPLPLPIIIYGATLRLNPSTTPDLKFYKLLLCTVLDPVTGNVKASWLCRIPTDLPDVSSRSG
jgi:hypothetical protein